LEPVSVLALHLVLALVLALEPVSVLELEPE
jgi:hypothetical protein